MVIGQGRTVTYNGEHLSSSHLPFISPDENLIITNSTDYVEVILVAPPLRVFYNGVRTMQVTAHSDLQGSMCGLCGPANTYPEDDNTVGPNTSCSGAEEADTVRGSSS